MVEKQWKKNIFCNRRNSYKGSEKAFKLQEMVTVTGYYNKDDRLEFQTCFLFPNHNLGCKLYTKKKTNWQRFW